jgi:hypothetical protein
VRERVSELQVRIANRLIDLGIYDDRKDTLVRTELHGKREELDALAAT